jgi:hypothetical protein
VRRIDRWAGAESDRADLSRRRAATLLVAVVAAAFALRIASFRHGLPHVFHSDYAQVDEAVALLQNGRFVHGSPYPVTHVYAYAAFDLGAYLAGRLAGRWPSWPAFLEEFERDETHHALARAYTAAMGALLPLAVYRLARLRLRRRASVVAAALLAASALHVAYAHQARIHVPAITVLAFAARSVVALGLGARGVRRSVAAGAACGVAATISQLGLLLGLAAATLVLARTRLARDALRSLAAGGLGMSAAVGAFFLAGHLPGVVELPPDATWSARMETLGLQMRVQFAPWRNLPALLGRWVLAEPTVAAGLAMALARATRPNADRAALAAFGAYPIVAFLVLGTNYDVPRYSLSMTPFLAILAAAGWEAIGARAVRIVALVVALGVPTAASVRYDATLRAIDTRLALLEALERFATEGRTALVDAQSLPPRPRLPRGILKFPRDESYRRAWDSSETPGRIVRESTPDVVVWRRIGGRASIEGSIDLESLGYRLAARVDPGVERGSYFPDAPTGGVPDFFRTRWCGPAAAVFTRSDEAAGALARACAAAGMPLDRP